MRRAGRKFSARRDRRQTALCPFERLQAAPVGVNWQDFERLAAGLPARTKAAAIRRAVGAERLLLGIDRLDYTKGILERLGAYELFLQNNPHYIGKVSLVQIGVPSRSDISDYRDLKVKIEEAVGRINGRYDRIGGPVPVRYICGSFGKEDLVAYYLAADVALVTALRDGLNLVAKEFVSCRLNNTGVLVLSRFAGAAEELKEAVLINPYDREGLARAISTALEMPAEEAAARMKALRRTVQKNDLYLWWQNTISRILPPRVDAALSLPADA